MMRSENAQLTDPVELKKQLELAEHVKKGRSTHRMSCDRKTFSRLATSVDMTAF